MPRPRLSLFLFYVLAFALSWTAWYPLVAVHLGYGLPASAGFHLLGSVGPAFAAVLVSLLPFSPIAFRTLLARLSWRRTSLRGLAFAIGLPVAIGLAGLFAQAQLSGSPMSFDGVTRSREFPELTGLTVMAASVLFYGFGEEIGWRGYALPVINRQLDGLSSALVMTPPWTLWHIPLLLSSPTYQSLGMAGIAGWVVSLATGSVMLTYLFHLSGRSLIVVAIFHAFIDLAMTNAAVQPIGTQAMGALVTLLGIAAAFGCRHIAKDAFWPWSEDGAPARGI